MCLGCEGLLSSKEIRSAFAAARGLSAAPRLEPSNLDPFGERLDLKCLALKSYVRNACLRPRSNNPRTQVQYALASAPASWWKQPKRLHLTCYAAQPREDGVSNDDKDRKPKYARTATETVSDSSVGESKPGVDHKISKIATKTRLDPVQQIPIQAELSPRDYWDFL